MVNFFDAATILGVTTVSLISVPIELNAKPLVPVDNSGLPRTEGCDKIYPGDKVSGPVTTSFGYAPRQKVYFVQQGDWLSRIAEKFGKITADELCAKNPQLSTSKATPTDE